MLTMTFHESYGPLPTKLLRTYRRVNVSPADHDTVLRCLGHVWSDTNINWTEVIEFVEQRIHDGRLYLPRFA
jgi:hypothetical protein